MTLSGKSCRLVPLERRHGEKTREWANDLELGRLLDRGRPVSELEHEAWMKSVLDRSDAVFFAIESDVGHVGNVWLWAIDARHQKAELRIIIGDERAMGRGVGTEAIALVCKYAFERLNLHKIYAYVLGINPRARRAFEKAEFKLEGTLREDRWSTDRFVDVFLLGRLR